MDIDAWARINKKRIAREFVRLTDFQKSPAPSGIFTAGLPGAGKTEFTVELIKNLQIKPVRIDMDEIATHIEGYKPQMADKFRAGATIILERIYDEVTKHCFDFVFDGTFGHGKAIQNLQRAIDHNYAVKIYYIHQDPIHAWRFTQDREFVEHRAIDKHGFIDTYLSLQENLRILHKDHKNVTISLVIKDRRNKIGSRMEDVDNLFEVLPKFLTADELGSVLS
ncbi:MAG TPA: zeta toxin family protein [Candidatus Saccharimonadales bacterium]